MLNLNIDTDKATVKKGFLYRTLNEIGTSYIETLSRIFNSDGELMSAEAKKILSNPEDKKKYLDALEELRVRRISGEQAPEKPITLSTGEEIVLTSY